MGEPSSRVSPSGAYDPAALPAGERVGKFIRVSRLGTGGMGEVWKAWDVELSRWVALKFLRGGDDDEFARFRREAQMAGRLSHPNIAAIYEIGDLQGRPFIAMQLVDGHTLLQLRCRDLRRLARLASAAARAVGFAHERGVVHRDLKPDNVMVAADDHVYVMDFGLARPMEAASRVSVTGCVVGTPGYMAPEQARGDRVDARADVYGLGATLYALLAGGPPFSGPNVLQILRAVQEDEPRPLRRLEPSVPRELETIIHKCLEKERGRRYATMAELADDLDRWLAGEPIRAHASTVYRFRKAVARHRGAAIALLAAIVLVPVAALVLHRALRERRDLEARTRDLEAQARASRARDEAFRLLEMARPALDRAHRALYEAATPHEDVVRAAEDARSLIEDAARRAPDLALAHHLLGRAWAVQGRRDLAEASWRRAIALDPDLGPAHGELGRALVARAFLASLVRTPRADGKGEEIRLLGEEAVRALERATRSRGEADPELERDLAAAFLAWARGDPAAAESLARAGASRHAGKMGAEEFDWLAGFATTRADARVRDYDRAIARRPKFDLALVFRGFEHVVAGRTAEAIEDFTRALRANPHFNEALGLRGMARLNSGDFRGALADADDLLARTGAAAEYLNRGVVHAALGDAGAALADYEEAARRDPTLAEAHLNVANAHGRAGRPEQALAAYAEAARLNPNLPDIYNGRAGVHVQRKDFDAAFADWARCLELKPDHLQALASRGQILARCGRGAEARKDLERALKIAPAGWPHRAMIERELARLKD